MKQALLMFASALLGAGIGCLVCAKFAFPTGQTLRVREISLVDERGGVIAKLGSEGSRSSLVFYTTKGVPSVELGTDRSDNRRFLNFWRDDHGSVLASLYSQSTGESRNGVSTLVLGDNGWEGRVLVGFLDSEIIGGANNWGLLIPDHLHNTPGPLAYVTDDGRSDDKLTGRIGVYKADGNRWFVH